MGNNSIEKMRGLIHTLNKFGRQQLNNSWFLLTKIKHMMRVLYFLFQNAIRCLVCYFGQHFYCLFSTLLNTLDCCVSHSVRGLYRMNIFSLSIVCTFFTFFSKYCKSAGFYWLVCISRFVRCIIKFKLLRTWQKEMKKVLAFVGWIGYEHEHFLKKISITVLPCRSIENSINDKTYTTLILYTIFFPDRNTF